MALSLKQRLTFHKKRRMTPGVKVEDESFSIGYSSGHNLFSDDWAPDDRKKVIKETFNDVKKLSSKHQPSLNDVKELNRKKGLLSYVGDLRKEKAKKGLSLYDKRLNK